MHYENIIIIIKKTNNFKTNVLEAIDKLKLYDSKNHFCIAAVYSTGILLYSHIKLPYFLLLTTPLIVVFFPVVCSLILASTEKRKGTAWIQSYLSDRHSFVQVGRSAACQQPCIAGVPQGSVLRPLLFTASRRSVALSADSVSVHIR